MAPQWQHTQWAETQGRQGAQNQQNPTEEWQGAQTQSDQQDQARSHRWQHPPGHRGDKAQDRRRELYRAKLDIKRLEDRLEEVKEQCQLEKRVMALEHQKKVSDMLAQAAAMALNHQAELARSRSRSML